MNDKPLPRIAGFRMIRELGRGGMASVYLAVQESLDREVALKIMSSSLLAADDDFTERFVNEGRTIAKLNHPHVVTVYDTAVFEGHHYIAMEYINGENLKSRMRRGLSAEDGVKIIQEVAAALGYAHDKGFVHRDIKPDNILLREDGTAVLTDFGIAKATGGVTRMTATGMSIGTPHYMSPEQIRGHNVDPRADLYSLGVVLYEVLTNQPPFDATDSFALGMKHIHEPVPRLPAALKRYQAVLDRLLAKEPEQRYPSAAALSEALESTARTAEVPPAAPTEMLPTTPGTSSRKKLWVSGGATALIIAAAVTVVLSVSRNPPPTDNTDDRAAGQPPQTPLPDSNTDEEAAVKLTAVRDFLEDNGLDAAQVALNEARALGADGEEVAGLERRLQELQTRRTLARELLAKAKAALDANRLSEAQGHCESATEFFSSVVDDGVCMEVAQRRVEVKKQWQQQNIGTQGTTQVR